MSDIFCGIYKKENIKDFMSMQPEFFFSFVCLFCFFFLLLFCYCSSIFVFWFLFLFLVRSSFKFYTVSCIKGESDGKLSRIYIFNTFVLGGAKPPIKGPFNYN